MNNENSKPTTDLFRLTVLGARGSVPVHGDAYSRYGGATSSYLVEAGDQAIFIDAGSGIVTAPTEGLKHKKITLLLTHPHLDHLIGLPFFPALNDPSCEIRICGVERQGRSVQQQIDELFCPPYWPCRLSEYPATVIYHTLSYQLISNDISLSDGEWTTDVPSSPGTLCVRAMEVPHPGGCTAWRISYGEHTLVIATDAELPTPDEHPDDAFISLLRGADLFLCDSQYTDPEAVSKTGYGHSTLTRALAWKEAAGVGRLVLVHHDPRHDDQFLEEMVAQSKSNEVTAARSGEVIEIAGISGSSTKEPVHGGPEAAPAGSDPQKVLRHATGYDDYIERMADIRRLSSPQLIWTDRSETYSDRLRGNFRRIGELAGKNRTFLDSSVFPLTTSGDPLDEATVQKIRSFMNGLVNIDTVENLDVSIMSLLSDRLMRDAEQKGDEEYIVQQLDVSILACIISVYMTSRIVTNPALSDALRRQGLALAERILVYLEPDRFSRLSDNGKEHVLMSARRHTALYGSVAGITAETAHRWTQALDRALAISTDPVYTDAFPGFDWQYYRFRTLEQYSGILDYLYGTRPYSEDIARIAACLTEQEQMWARDPDACADYASRDFILLSLHHAEYLAGTLSLAEYRERTLTLYSARNRQKYDFDNLYVNLRSPLNYILTFDPHHMNEEERALLKRFYRSVCSYAFRMQGGGTLGELLEYLTPILTNFIEQPGETTLEQMSLQLMAALHPPTYVHSLTVANLTRCLCGALLERSPEHLIGICGCRTAEEVRSGADRILNYAYHAALCHDFGKIPLVDTIFVYGRNLLDSEFNVIRQHPDLGAFLMERCGSTRDFADVARGHHRWYNNQGGYPADFDTSASPVKGIIDIVTVADCLDAATDTIGRSYSRGKTLDQFTAELRAGSGTRYAPYVAELFEDDEIRRQLGWLLETGRGNNYRSTYSLLRGVQEQEVRAREVPDTDTAQVSFDGSAYIRTCARGEIIFDEGAESNCMFEVRSGRVGIYKMAGSKDGKLLAEIGAEEIFGEMGLIEGVPRSARAVALEDNTQIVRITWPILGEYFKDNPSRIVRILQQSSDRLRVTTKHMVQAETAIRHLEAAIKEGCMDDLAGILGSFRRDTKES